MNYTNFYEVICIHDEEHLLAHFNCNDNVDIWITNIDEGIDADLLREYGDILSTEEITKMRALPSQEVRARYLITRAMVRCVLSRYTNIHPSEWKFSATPYGRPVVASSWGLSSPLSFNVAHSENLIALVVATERDVGIDIERIARNVDSIELARCFYFPVEAADISSRIEPYRSYRFMEYWTLKEAYVKACGLGLSVPFDHFSFDLSQHRKIVHHIHSVDLDTYPRCAFKQYSIENYHLLAVCIGIKERDFNIIFRHIVPLISDRISEEELLRSTTDT